MLGCQVASLDRRVYLDVTLVPLNVRNRPKPLASTVLQQIAVHVPKLMGLPQLKLVSLSGIMARVQVAVPPGVWCSRLGKVSWFHFLNTF